MSLSRRIATNSPASLIASVLQDASWSRKNRPCAARAGVDVLIPAAPHRCSTAVTRPPVSSGGSQLAPALSCSKAAMDVLDSARKRKSAFAAQLADQDAAMAQLQAKLEAARVEGERSRRGEEAPEAPGGGSPRGRYERRGGGF